MIVRDEERFLRGALASVADVVDELCIVDTGSTDATVAIAREFGATIAFHAWTNDFAAARNAALALATRRWILVLDADEELDAAAKPMLRALRDVPAATTGVWIRCQNLADDYKGTGVSSHALIRIFPNDERIRYRSRVHEFIALDGSDLGLPACSSPISIVHYGYLSDVIAARNKAHRNLDLVRAAVADDSADPFNWFNLGSTAILCDEHDVAVEALEEMLRLVGDAPRGFVPNGLVLLANCYADAGRLDDAVPLLERALRIAPHFANAHFTLGKTLAKARRYADARAAFLAAIACKDHTAKQFVVDDEISVWKAHCEIGTVYGQEGDAARALEWFERGLANRPGVSTLLLNRARALEALGRYDEARAAFEALEAADPGDTSAVALLNYVLRRRDHPGALAVIERVLDTCTPRTQASLLVAAAHVARETNSPDVRRYLERACERSPGAADALEPLEALYAAGGEHERIAALRERESAAVPVTAGDHRRRAALAAAGGDHAAAAGFARAGLALDGADAELRYALATALLPLDEKEEAASVLAQVPPAGDVGLRAQFLRSIVLADLGRRAEALTAIEAVLSAAPQQADAQIHRFRLLCALDRCDEAEARLRETVAVADRRVITEYAGWLLARGRFDEAREIADAALRAA